MKASQNTAASAALWIAVLASMAGCHSWGTHKTPTPPLGTQSDCFWRNQEVAAAASEFVMYEHEFVLNETGLNMGGEDHLRSIAARLHDGAAMPVIIERSMTSERPDSTYKYPVNPNPDLDMRRRDAVVKDLVALGIADADQCVVVAPALAEGYTATEAIRSYNRGLSESTSGRTGFGGGNGVGGGGVGGF
jgi:hypothetical protein